MADDSDSDSPPVKKVKKDSSSALPMCPYGEKCYRKNPVHFKEFSHPSKDGSASTSTSTAKSNATVQIDTSKLPPCPFGASCYRKNLLHFAQFSHPTSGKGAMAKDMPSDESGSDTDVYDSADEEKVEASTSKLGRASSLVKKYSQMTEEERKDLIKKAFEMKEKLEKELKETKAEVESKVKQLKSLQDEVTRGALLMEGETEALASDTIKYFDLFPERSYKEGSAAQLHFRLAESQFYRLLSGPAGAGYQVKKVQYVVNPKLVKQFKKSREYLAKNRGEKFSYPVLAFHGTQIKNITPICEGGFKVPGEKGFTHRTDTGYYGRGAYFSEFPGFSIGYIQGATKLLLCQILTGKVYQCTKLIQGEGLKDGFDSHRSPSKKELVIFRSDYILPCYIVHYANTKAEFKYLKPPDEQPRAKDIKELMKMFWKAKKKRKSKLLAGRHIRVCGKLCESEDGLGELIEKHGGKYVDNDSPTSAVTHGKTKGRGRGRATVFAHVPPCPPIVPGTLGWVYYNGKYMKQWNMLVTTEKAFTDNKLEPITYYKTMISPYGNQTILCVRQEWLLDSIIDGEVKDTEDYIIEET